MDARRDNGHGGADVRGQPQKAAPLDAATAAEAEFAGNLRPRNAPTAQLEQSGVDLGSPFEAMRHHFVLYIARSIGHIVLTGAMVRRERWRKTMAQYEIHNRVSGLFIGVYDGDSEDAALDTMSRDAGYESFAHCSTARETDETSDRNEMDVRKVVTFDTSSLEWIIMA
jgi:hypothetical protein